MGSWDNINRRGFNKFLKMEGDIKVTIDYAKHKADAEWDGLKGGFPSDDAPERASAHRTATL